MSDDITKDIPYFDAVTAASEEARAAKSKGLAAFIRSAALQKWAARREQEIVSGRDPVIAHEDAASRTMGDPVKSYPPRTTLQATKEND